MPGLGLPGNDVHASFSDELTSSHWVFPHWPMLMHVLGICEIKGFQNWWHKIMTTGGQHHTARYIGWHKGSLPIKRSTSQDESFQRLECGATMGKEIRAKGLWGGVWKGEGGSLCTWSPSAPRWGISGSENYERPAEASRLVLPMIYLTFWPAGFGCIFTGCIQQEVSK